MDLLHALTHATDFETAAVATLTHALRCVRAALDASHFRTARCLRAMVHLRPGDGYLGLYVLEAGANRLSDLEEVHGLLPSLGAWRLVGGRGEAVAVDVLAGTLRAQGGPTLTGTWPPPLDVTDSSRQRLLARDATHVYAVPLWTPGAVAGMVSVEVACMDAVEREFIWADCAAELATAAALAGPYLTALPRAVVAGGAQADPLLPVVGASMRDLVRVAKVFAGEEETLLIRGETGTGKSRLARWIHAHSARAKGPFEVLDLLTVPPETQLGELFGWRRGAFTGAVADHVGYVGRADGGTLFLDEIDKLSLDAQAALLTLIEERHYRTLGDAGARRPADLRFVVGTNVDLKAAVAAGTFREDLYYRINVLPIRLPPLRERGDEIGDWTRFFLARRHGARGGAVTLTAAAERRLGGLAWPGNLRQLDNLVRRAYTLASMDAGAELMVDAKQIELALAFERDGPPEPALGAVRAALGQLVTGWLAADSRPDLESQDVPTALFGMLLAEALSRTQDRDEAFRLVGREELIRNRNHHKALKRAWSRMEDLYAALGEPVPEALVALLA